MSLSRDHVFTRSLVNLGVSLGAALLAPACGVEPDTEVASTAQDLYANGDTFVPGAGMTRIDIPVCWENPAQAPGVSKADKAAWRDARRRAVEVAWGNHARINFSGWDDSPAGSTAACSPGAPGLHIRICSGMTAGSDPLCPALPSSQAQPGGYPVDDGLANGIRLNPAHVPSVLVHEVGHALGFYHAEERPDLPASACTHQSFPNANPVMLGAYDADSVMSYCSPPAAEPWLSANDITAIQRVYGRRVNGSLVTTRGNCATIEHAKGLGAPGFVADCTEPAKDQEFIDSLPADHLGWIFRHRDATGGDVQCLSTDATGRAVMGICNTPASHWRLEDMAVTGFGGMCLDVRAHVVGDGTPIRMAACGDAGGLQGFTRTTDSQLQLAGTNLCARVGADGLLALAACSTVDPAQHVFFVDGALTLSDGACLDVIGPSDAQYLAGQGLPESGARIRRFACNGSMNQRWHLAGSIKQQGDANQCLDRTGDRTTGDLVVRACNGGESQAWDYYF